MVFALSPASLATSMKATPRSPPEFAAGVSCPKTGSGRTRESTSENESTRAERQSDVRNLRRDFDKRKYPPCCNPCKERTLIFGYGCHELQAGMKDAKGRRFWHPSTR